MTANDRSKQKKAAPLLALSFLRKAKHPPIRWGGVLAVVSIVLCGLAVYANAIRSGFVLDDQLLVAGNAYIRSLSGIPHFFTENIASGSGANWGFWRPLQMVTYAFDYSLWSLAPEGYHLANIAWHIFAAVCMWYAIRLLFPDGLTALFTALLFVVHPVHTEAVTYISGRADPLALVCMLSSFIFYVNYARSARIRFYFFALACFTAALLSRENSLMFPFVLLLYHAAFKVRIPVKALLPFFAVALLYIFLRLTALNFQRPDAVSFMQRLPGFFAALTDYARLIVMPVGLHMEYGKRLFSWSDWRVPAGMIITVVLLYAIVRARKADTPVFFGLGFFTITLLPQANLLYPINAYMAEHWLYIPSVGIFLIAAYFLSQVCRKDEGRFIGIGLFTLLVVFYGVLTVRQNAIWRDPRVLYESTLKYAPDSSRILVCLGNELSRGQDFRRAIILYKKAVSIDPSADAFFNLGNAYRLTGDADSAIAAYRKALDLEPGHSKAQHNLDQLLLAISG